MAQQNRQDTSKSISITPINAKILYSGVLMKKGEYHKSWKERWFVLFDNRQCAYYHTRDDFQDSKRPINTIDLKQVTAIQPVNKSMYNDLKNNQETKPNTKKKKSLFSRSFSERDQSKSHNNVSRSQSLHHDIEDSYNSQSSLDSPIPSMNTTPHSNSLRLSFKSLMGKKSSSNHKNSLNTINSINGSNHRNPKMSIENSYEDSVDGTIFQAEFPFEIVTASRHYLLCCLDAYSFNDWLEHLRNITFGKKIYGGWLTKQGSKNKSWKKRWFVIFDTREIRYYENEKTSLEKGSIILDDLQIMNLLEDKQAKSMYKKKNVFELVCGGRKWVLVANTKEERELWFNRVVQVVPNVQRLDPLYSNELSYKRNDRAKKWMRGYFAMDVEYLFFFKNKISFDTFKSSAYFQEDLYTLALAQHVQGLIPLRNRKIKELDRNHPACNGKNKFVFSLKTSAGEFFLSTQYSIQMDDWLDAFRELYRLEVQEKRQGVISKRRKHSNSFGRRPPSPPSRAGSTASNKSFNRRPSSPRHSHRSISPTPSNTSHHYNAAKVDDEKQAKLRQRNSRAGVAEVGNLKHKKPTSNHNHSNSNSNNHSDKPNVGGGYYNMPNKINGFQAKNQLAPAHKHSIKKKPPPSSKKHRNTKEAQSPDSDNDSPPPPMDDFLEDNTSSPPPPNKPPGQYHRRTNTPFKDVDDMMRARRKSREKIFGDDAHYDIGTKNHPKANKSGNSGDFEMFTTTTLNEGHEGSSGDSDEDKKRSKGKKSGRSKRKNKKRKPSVGQVLKSKIKNMRSGKKQKKMAKAEAKKRKKSKERKEKERQKEEKKKAKQRKEREKKKAKNKKNKKNNNIKTEKLKIDPMKSLEQTKKDAAKEKKKKEKKVRRRSVGDVLKGALSGSKKKEPEIKVETETQKKTTSNNLKPESANSGRRKRKDKIRRRSTGEALNNDSDEEKNEVIDAKIIKSNTLHAPSTNTNTNTNNGRRKRKDKTRRRSVNDVIKDPFGSKKKDDDKKIEEKKEEIKTKKKKKDKGPRRVSLGDAFRWGSKKKENDIIEEANKKSKTKNKNRNKPPQIATSNRSSSSSDEDNHKRNGNINRNGNGSRKNRNKQKDTSDELAVYKNKINAKTRKRNARHARHETPQYDIATKDLLKDEYEAALSGNDDIMVADEILSEDPEEYDVNTPRGDDTPKAPPRGYRTYRTQMVEITEKKKKKGGKTPITPNTPSKKARGFRQRGEDKDNNNKSRDSKNNKSFAVKQIGGKKAKSPIKDNRTKSKKNESHKNRRRNRNRDRGWRKDDDSDDTESDDDTDESEYETDSDTDSDTESESNSESEYETGSSDEYTSGDTDSDSTESETDSDDDSDESEYESEEYTDSDMDEDTIDAMKTPGGTSRDSELYNAIIADFEKNKDKRPSDAAYDASYDWNKMLTEKATKNKTHNIVKDKHKKDKPNKSNKKNKKEKERLKEKEKKKKEEERKKKEKEEEERKKMEQEKERKRQEAKERQLKLESERKQKEKEQAERKRKQELELAKQKENEFDGDYNNEEEEDSSSEEDESEDESESESEEESEEEEEDDDSLESNSDEEQEEIDAAMKAYVQLNNDTTAVLPEGDEHKEWERLEAAKRLQMKHRRRSTELMKWNTQQLIAEENDDPTVDQNELNKIWMKLKTIPRSSRKDTRETRIVKEFMMFQLNHDHSIRDDYIIISSMNYPNIYQWNGFFIGPFGTPYVNGKYKIIIKFTKEYPNKAPKITFLTKIYNSSVKHNKRYGGKKRGLLKLPKFFDRIWSKKISLRQWLNVVYEFLFFYCGDHFFDPMNARVAREFIFAFDSFIDTCYQWNLIFADGYMSNTNMLELYDQYGERQKLTFHCAPYQNQFDIKHYNMLKEFIWQTIRKNYKFTYESFIVLLDYFGNEFYYSCLSNIIREPHICVSHKVKKYDNIVKW